MAIQKTGYFDTFTAGDFTVHELFLDAIHAQSLYDVSRRAAGERIGSQSKELRGLALAYDAFKAELNDLAAITAKDFDKAAKAFFDETVVRQVRVTPPYLRTLIRSRPLVPKSSLPLAAVGLASITSLNRAINPNTGGSTYWRAQEYGTGFGEVPSQLTANTGRYLQGYFYGRGLTNPERPSRAFSGNPDRSHPIFVSSGTKRGPGGGKGGAGRVRHEIKPRLFLTRAADVTFREYAQRAHSIERRAIARLPL